MGRRLAVSGGEDGVPTNCAEDLEDSPTVKTWPWFSILQVINIQRVSKTFPSILVPSSFKDLLSSIIVPTGETIPRGV